MSIIDCFGSCGVLNPFNTALNKGHSKRFVCVSFVMINLAMASDVDDGVNARGASIHINFPDEGDQDPFAAWLWVGFNGR